MIRIAHAPTNRFYKGSDLIISVCRKLESEKLVEFDLIENVSHADALERKGKSDIFINQIGNKGGWGYGMNSVESLSMGICTLTQINETYNRFIPHHPFIHITKNTLDLKLRKLIKNREKISTSGQDGKKWVEINHDIKNVSSKLYDYYRSIGLSC